jgi:protein SCO1/2
MRWSCVVALAAAGALLAGCGSSTSSAPPATSTAAHPAAPAANTLRGLVPEPFPVKPAFTLTDTAGRPYSFTKATRGKLTYLFFGYTHCPDACPATMSYIRYALGTQPASIRKQVAVVFVTVDPSRDTGPVLRRWLNHYGTSFVGLTGSLTQIGEVEHMAGVPTAILTKKKGVASYEVEHSSVLFVYSPDDRSHVVYATGFKPQDYAHDLPLLLKFR